MRVLEEPKKIWGRSILLDASKNLFLRLVLGVILDGLKTLVAIKSRRTTECLGLESTSLVLK